MNTRSEDAKDAADKLIRGIRRQSRKQYSPEEKIRIVLAGLRGEESIAALCRREGIAESLYYSWSKEFLEAGKSRLAGDTARQATTPGGTGVARRGRHAEGGGRGADPGEPPAEKKHARGWGGRRMRYPAGEKLEILRTVEASPLPVKRTLRQLGIPCSTY